MSISENRERLLRALRNEEFPEGFRWDFTNFGGCAMGLACRLGIVSNGWWPPVVIVADRLGIPAEDAERVFRPLDVYKPGDIDRYASGYRVHYNAVTPGMVARKLARLFKRYPVEDGGGK